MTWRIRAGRAGFERISLVLPEQVVRPRQRCGVSENQGPGVPTGQDKDTEPQGCHHEPVVVVGSPLGAPPAMAWLRRMYATAGWW